MPTWANVWALILPLGFAVVFYFFSGRGEMCSAVTRAAAGDDLTTVRDKAFVAFRAQCRQRSKQHEIIFWSFSTVSSGPHSFTFILGPLNMPFRVDSTVKIRESAAIALAEDETDGSIYAEINIGGSTNTRAVIRACYYQKCEALVAVHNDAGLVDANEYRPFWIEYKEGNVTVGKGGQEEAFLEWDAGTYHHRIPTHQLHVGIASWGRANGDWVFYQFSG